MRGWEVVRNRGKGGLIRVAGNANTSKRQTRLTVKITELGETKVSWRYKLQGKSVPGFVRRLELPVRLAAGSGLRLGGSPAQRTQSADLKSSTLPTFLFALI